MPTLGLRVQQDGTWQGYSSLVGGSFAYQVVGDSDSATHDGAATYLTLPKLTGEGVGRVSFPLFLQAEGLHPTSITLYVAAQRGGAIHPQIQIGFARGGLFAFSGSKYDPPASFGAATSRTFSTNPITGQPWSLSDLVGLEACVQNESGVNGNNDLTLVSGSMDYYPDTNTRMGVLARRGVQ